MAKGTLKSVTGGTKRKTLDRRVDELERLLLTVSRQAVDLESKLARMHATLRKVVESNNHSNLLLSCVERHLDATVGEDWDAGVRAEVEKRAELLRRRKEIMERTQRERKTLKIEERVALARELWVIARELDIRAEDTAAVVALHLQNSDVDSALDIVEEVQRDQLVLPDDLSMLVNKLLARCIEVAREAGNDLLLRRAAKLARVSEDVLSQISKP